MKRKALSIVIEVVEKKKKLTKPCLLLFGTDKQLTATNGDVNRTVVQISGKFLRKGSERQNLINQHFTPQEGWPPHHHHQSNSGNYEVVIQLNPGLEDESQSNWS